MNICRLNRHKLLCLIATVCMVLTMPNIVFAEDSQQTNTEQLETTNTYKKASELESHSLPEARDSGLSISLVGNCAVLISDAENGQLRIYIFGDQMKYDRTVAGDTKIVFTSKEAISANGFIEVDATAAPVNLVFDGLMLTSKRDSPLKLATDSEVYLTLSNTNVLNCEGGHKPGVNVPEGARISIVGPGTLAAKGDSYAAGIGTEDESKVPMGYVSISDGAIVHSTGGKEGAGIGSGNEARTGGTLLITGKNTKVYAQCGDYFGAGIGGGDHTGGLSETRIEDGAYVEATGGNHASGIGSGNESSDGIGPIIISSSTVRATGGTYGAGIGGGDAACGASVSIRDGSKVVAIGGGGHAPYGGGAGIGSGDGPFFSTVSAGTLLVEGDTTEVYATG